VEGEHQSDNAIGEYSSLLLGKDCIKRSSTLEQMLKGNKRIGC